MGATSTSMTTSLSGGLDASRSVLDGSRLQMPTSGKIRAGIKVLTAAGKGHPKAQGIYDAGVKAGKGWDAIEAELRKECDFEKSPLTPKNVPYFTVFPHDFTPSTSAALIMEKYGEDKGEGRKLYSFPIVFAIDNLQHVLPHALRAFRRSELEYWSEFDEAGNRLCMTHAAVEVNERARRARIPFGGRARVPRQDNGGICDPDKCPQFQNGDCKLSGEVLGYIPGIPGAGMVGVPTTSIYSLKQMRDKLVVVNHLRGRISGLIKEKPIFWLTKQQQEVSMIDRESGKPKKVLQWIIVLEERMDVFELMAARETAPALAAGAQAAAALSAPVVDLPHETPAPVAPAPEPKPRTAEDVRAEIEGYLLSARVRKGTFGKWAAAEYGAEYKDDIEILSKLVDAAIALKEGNAELRAKVMAHEQDDSKL